MLTTKSRLLSYLKHTEEFEKDINVLVALSIEEILDYIKSKDMLAYATCVFHFSQQGVDLNLFGSNIQK